MGARQVTEHESGTSKPNEGANPSDFEALYRAEFGFVYRSTRRLGVPEPFVEDAVQDVFLVAYRRRADFEGRSSIRTWLFGITLRVARNHRRRIARKDQHDELPEQLGDDGPSPERTAELEQAKQVLDEFLESLDEGKRAVFIFSELEQATAPEVAEALGIPVNTVYSRLRAARTAFEAAVKRFRARQDRVER